MKKKLTVFAVLCAVLITSLVAVAPASADPAICYEDNYEYAGGEGSSFQAGQTTTIYVDPWTTVVAHIVWTYQESHGYAFYWHYSTVVLCDAEGVGHYEEWGNSYYTEQGVQYTDYQMCQGGLNWYACEDTEMVDMWVEENWNSYYTEGGWVELP